MSASSAEIADLLRRFGADLDRLRVAAGITSLRALARAAHYSHTTIADAAGGRKFPSLQVTLAFVTACGGDVREWRERWARTFAAVHEPAAAAVPWPRQEVADGSDPMGAGCHFDAISVRAVLVSITGRRQIIGRLELRHSPRTHAAWGRFLGEPGLDMIALHRHQVDVAVGVTRAADGRRQEFATEYAFDHHFSGLLVTGNGPLFAWVVVRFDGVEVACGETERWQELATDTVRLGLRTARSLQWNHAAHLSGSGSGGSRGDSGHDGGGGERMRG